MALFQIVATRKVVLTIKADDKAEAIAEAENVDYQDWDEIGEDIWDITNLTDGIKV